MDSFSVVFPRSGRKECGATASMGVPRSGQKKRPTHRQMLGRDLWWVNIREGWKKKKTKERVRQLGDFL
jgi:hypothetical protein